MRAAFSGLRHPASASCLGRHLRLAGRCPNNSSLFPPLAAVVVVALRIFSGKYILNFGVLKSLRTFQNPFFTEGVWNKPSQAHFVRQLPRRGSFLHLSVSTNKAPPFGGAGTPSGVTERVYFYCTFTMRKVFPRLMQSSSRSYSAGTSPMTFTFSSAGRSVRMS